MRFFGRKLTPEQLSRQGSFLDRNGQVIEDSVYKKDTPTTRIETQKEVQNILSKTPPYLNTGNIISTIKKISGNLIKKETKTTVNIAGQEYDLQIKPTSADSIDSLTLQIKIRPSGARQYEVFEVDFNPISFQKYTNRSDGSLYHRLSPLQYKRIIKTGGAARKVYGARGDTSDESRNITSFSYFFYIFKIPRHKGGEMQNVIHKQVYSFIEKYYMPSNEE